MRRAEVSVGPEDLALHLFRKVRGDDQGVGGGEGEAPRRARMAPADLEDDPKEAREVELIAAEHPGLQDPVEAGVLEGLVDLLGVAASLVGLVLLVAQQRDQGPRPLDHDVRGQSGLGLGQGGH